MRFLLIILALYTALFSQTAIALYDLEGSGLSSSELAGLSSRLRTELFKTGQFTVVERSEMDKILKEQGIQLSGCTGSECAVEIGQLLNVQKVVVGTIEKVGTQFAVDVRIVDVAAGNVEKAVSEDCRECAAEDLLNEKMRSIAVQLAGQSEEQMGVRLRKAAKTLKRSEQAPHIKELRVVPGVQFYIERDLYGTPPDTFIIENNELTDSGWEDSLAFHVQDRKSLPFVSLELGLLTRNSWYHGVYGQLFYVGGMYTFRREWSFNEKASASAGVKVGFLRDSYADGDHVQFGGPELQASLGGKRIRFGVSSVLWLDMAEGYGTNPKIFRTSKRWYDVERFEFSVSPSVTAKIQFVIPASKR